MSTTLTDFQLDTTQIEQSRVVVVDDDSLVTRSLSSFLGLEMDIEPIVFNESPKAAAYLREHEADLIISDFRRRTYELEDIFMEIIEGGKDVGK